jgi:acetolactate synthase I/II/III large subunit
LPTHADMIAKSLARCGVKYAFGLPGGEIAAFMDACQRADIRVLLTGHESSAAWMAQVFGQITGIPGVCFATLGPGATNLVTGVANAFLDRAPLLAVTAQIPVAVRETLTHQRLNIEALFTPVTKRTAVVGTIDTCGLVDDCISLATTPRPGPVLLVLPSDTAKQEHHCSSQLSKPKFAESRGDTHDSLSQLREKVAVSQRPLILIGLGAPPLAAGEIRELVEKLEAPFLVTPKAKGILPEDHPLFVGVASGMAIDRDIVETLRAADLVLSIGFDPVEADSTWFAEVNMATIDSVSMAEGAYRPPETIGDLRSLVSELTTLIAEPKPWSPELLQTRRKVLKRTPGCTGQGVSTLGLIEGLRSVFPRNGIVTCDVGSHKLLMGQFWRSYEPGTFFMSNGLSGMGFGVPAAVAAQLSNPDRAVMAVVGDGGMLMMSHDLVLIRELGLPIIIVVLKDNSLSLIRVAQERRGYPPCGVDFTSPDFAAIAEAFGICGQRAETVAQAQGALATALRRRTPFLLEVPVDLREYYDLV